MSKNILFRNTEIFRQDVIKLPFGTIKKMIAGITKYCSINLNIEDLLNLQRKETILWGELSRRGYDIKGFEFTMWRKSLKHKKRIY